MTDLIPLQTSDFIITLEEYSRENDWRIHQATAKRRTQDNRSAPYVQYSFDDVDKSQQVG
jgi:hypothetical protein